MSRYRNLALFVFLAAAWGAAFMAIKAGLGTPADPGGFFETPVLFAAIRYDVAGVLMLGYAVYATDSPLPRGRDEWATVVVGSVLIMAGYHALLFVGETDPAVTSAAAAVIVSLSPILTAGFARAFLPSERLAPAGLVGLLLGLAGVVVLSNPDPNNLLSGGAVAKLLIFGAATVFALGSVLTRRIDADLPIETMEAWTMLGGALLMHVVSVAIGESVSDGLLDDRRVPRARVSLARRQRRRLPRLLRPPEAPRRRRDKPRLLRRAGVRGADRVGVPRGTADRLHRRRVSRSSSSASSS